MTATDIRAEMGVVQKAFSATGRQEFWELVIYVARYESMNHRKRDLCNCMSVDGCASHQIELTFRKILVHFIDLLWIS